MSKTTEQTASFKALLVGAGFQKQAEQCNCLVPVNGLVGCGVFPEQIIEAPVKELPFVGPQNAEGLGVVIKENAARIPFLNQFVRKVSAAIKKLLGGFHKLGASPKPAKRRRSGQSGNEVAA